MSTSRAYPCLGMVWTITSISVIMLIKHTHIRTHTYVFEDQKQPLLSPFFVYRPPELRLTHSIRLALVLDHRLATQKYTPWALRAPHSHIDLSKILAKTKFYIRVARYFNVSSKTRWHKNQRAMTSSTIDFFSVMCRRKVMLALAKPLIGWR